MCYVFKQKTPEIKFMRQHAREDHEIFIVRGFWIEYMGVDLSLEKSEHCGYK